jgi:hypothetical protein
VNLAAAIALPPPPAPQFLDPSAVYVLVDGAAPTATGPVFHARNPGAWSSRLTVVINNADRGPVPITATAVVTDTLIQVRSAASFYRGAIVEIDNGADRAYREVLDILPGGQLLLDGAIGIAVTNPNVSFARVLEIDITITDESGAEPIVETFGALTWNPRNLPEVRRRHYATVINNRSRLMYAQPPNVGSVTLPPAPPGTPVPGQEQPPNIDTQPITPNGFATRR